MNSASLCVSPQTIRSLCKWQLMRILRHLICRGAARLLKLMQCEVLAGLGSLRFDAAMLWIQDEHIAVLPLGRALRAACIRFQKCGLSTISTQSALCTRY